MLLHVETAVNNQHLQLTINHLYCCILLVFFIHALLTMHGHRNISKLRRKLSSPKYPVVGQNWVVLRCAS